MVKEHHGRRMKKLEELIEERRQILQEHESGRRKLSEDDYARASKQFLNFQRKFGEMKTYTDVSL
jgi:protein-arginine kinase activator protein McsA